MKTKNQKILLFVANDYEDLELHYPRLRLLEAGKQVVIAGEKKEVSISQSMAMSLKQMSLSTKCLLQILMPLSFLEDMLLIL